MAVAATGPQARHATLDLWLALGLVLAVAVGATLTSQWRTAGPAPEPIPAA